MVALGLAQGLSQVEAVKQAGYSDSTAEKKAFEIVRRPQVQNFLTEALELVQGHDEMLEAAAEAIQPPDEDHVHLTPAAGAEKPV